MSRIYQCVFGIETGDIVRPSDGTGPYEVASITRPRYTEKLASALFVYRIPCFSLGLLYLDHPQNEQATINYVRQIGDRWFTYSGDEVLVEKPAARRSLPVDMFLSYPQTEEPFQFQADVHYEQEDMGYLWLCGKCGTHFNTEAQLVRGYAVCPRCANSLTTNLFIMPEKANALTLFSCSLGHTANNTPGWRFKEG